MRALFSPVVFRKCVSVCSLRERSTAAVERIVVDSARVLTSSHSTCTRMWARALLHRMCGSHAPLPRIAELQTVCIYASARMQSSFTIQLVLPPPSMQLHPLPPDGALTSWLAPAPPPFSPATAASCTCTSFLLLLRRRRFLLSLIATQSQFFPFRFVLFRSVSSCGETRLSLTVQQLLTRRLSLSLDASTCTVL